MKRAQLDIFFLKVSHAFQSRKNLRKEIPQKNFIRQEVKRKEKRDFLVNDSKI